MNVKRPLIRTTATPRAIVGRNMNDLKAHYALSLSTDSDNFDKKINSEFTKATRVVMGAVYENLRNSGFYVSGIDGHGDLIFSQLVSNDGVIYDFNHENCEFFEAGVKSPSKQEIKEMRLECRKNFNSAHASMTIHVKPEPEDYGDLIF